MPAWLDRMKSAVGLAEEEEQAEAGLLQQLDEATSEWSRAGPTVDACTLELLSPGVAACSSKHCPDWAACVTSCAGFSAAPGPLPAC